MQTRWTDDDGKSHVEIHRDESKAGNSELTIPSIYIYLHILETRDGDS